MTEEEKKNLIGYAFAKAKVEFLNLNTNNTYFSLNSISEHIEKDIKKTGNKISSKTIKNYFEYYYKDGAKVNPNDDKLRHILNYCYPKQKFQTIKTALQYFREDSSKLEFINKNLPFQDKISEEYLNASNIDIDNNVEDRPSISNTNYNSNNTTSIENVTINNNDDSNSKLYYTFVVIIFLILSVTTILIANQNSKKAEPKIEITNNNTINNNPTQIFPTQAIDFFDENSNEIKVWHINNNGEFQFFDAPGLHPVSREILQPVSRELVKELFPKNENNKTNYTETKLESKEEVLLPKSKVKSGFYNNDKQDEFFNIYFEKNYTKSQNYFYQGTTSYEFSKSEERKGLIICDITVIYKVFSKNTGKIIDTNSLSTNGSGFSEQEAKQRAISNLEL